MASFRDIIQNEPKPDKTELTSFCILQKTPLLQSALLERPVERLKRSKEKHSLKDCYNVINYIKHSD